MNENIAEFKKQGLELIISIYLNRKTDEDITFINRNVKSTQQLVRNVGSSLSSGLNQKSLQTNKIIYGQNTKRSTMGYNFFQLLGDQLINFEFIGTLIVCIVSIISGKYLNNQNIILDGFWILIFLLIITIIRFVIWYQVQLTLSKYSMEKNKRQIYRVLRNNQFIQIQQSNLITGDIVQLTHKDKIPASGILISNKQISINQSILGHKIQRKLSLQQCIKQIETMGVLQLKLAYQNLQLPSPVLIRDTQVIFGSGKMLILTIDDQQLINKFRVIKKSQINCKKFQQWNTNFINKWQQINIIIIIFIFIITILFYSLKKWLNRNYQINNFKIIWIQILKILLFLLTFYSIISKNIIKIFLRIRIMKFIMSINQPENFQKILTTQNILITQQNIVKYDQITLKKIASFQKRQLLNIQQINNLSNQQIQLFNQVIDGVLLDSPFNKNNYCYQDSYTHLSGKNYVLQIYKTYYKIVTIFDPTQIQATMKYSSFKRDHHNYPNNNQFSKNQQQLINVIRTNCKYTTQRILQGLMQIAQKKCKTYYYLKYNVQQLKKIKFIYLNGKQIQITKQQHQKMKIMARKIFVQNLIPIMLGYSNGFDIQQTMTVIIGIIGVTRQCQNLSINLLKKLENVGIKCMLLLSNQQNNITNINDIIQEYQGRDWIQLKNQQICQMETIRKFGGKLICGKCSISNCLCKDRVQQVSDPLSFMKFTNSLKIIYQINNQTDIYYLQSAFTQLRETCISITQNHTNTLKSIEDIFQGFRFIQAVQSGLLYYITIIIINASCLVIFYLAQAYVFFTRQMFGFLIFSQIIPLFGFSSNLNIQARKKNCVHKRVLVLLSKNSIILIILIIIIVFATISFIYFYPQFIPQRFSLYQKTVLMSQKNQKCPLIMDSIKLIRSFNPQLCEITANSLDLTDNIYSRHSTFLYNYLYWLNQFLYIIFFQNWFNIRTILSYIFGIGIYLLILLLSSTSLNIYFNSLTIQQFLISLALSILTIVLSKIIGYFIYGCFETCSQEIQNSIDYNNIDIKQHYSSVLKKYLNYSDDFILMRNQDD